MNNISNSFEVGLDKNIVDTVMRPFAMDLNFVNRLPYGSMPTSLYKRKFLQQITNKIGGVLSNAIAFIYSPVLPICTVVALDNTYAIACLQAIPADGNVNPLLY